MLLSTTQGARTSNVAHQPQTLLAVQIQVDFLAELMGLKKVGWVFSQANAGERDFIVSADELIAMAAVQVCACGFPGGWLGRVGGGAF